MVKTFAFRAKEFTEDNVLESLKNFDHCAASKEDALERDYKSRVRTTN